MKKKIFIISVIIFWISAFGLVFLNFKKEDSLTIKDNEREIFSNDEMVYISENGEKYHKKGCSYLPLRYEEIPESEAKRANIAPCERCN